MRRAGCATTSSSAPPPRPAPTAIAVGPHPGRPGRDVSAEADARRGPDRARRHLSAARRSSSGRCSTSSRADLRAYLAVARRDVGRGRDATTTSTTRATGSGTGAARARPRGRRRRPGRPLPGPRRWFARTASGSTSWPTSGFEALATATTDGLELDAHALAAEPPPDPAPGAARGACGQAAAAGRSASTTSRPCWRLLGGHSGGVDVPGSRVELRRGKLVLIQQKGGSEVILLILMPGRGRQLLNSTLKSLVFWMVLVVVGVLVWNFSTKFQTSAQALELQRVHGRGRRRPGRRASPSPATRSPASTRPTRTSAPTPRRSTKGWPTS